MAELDTSPNPCMRTDQRTEAIVQHAITLLSIAGAQEAARYLRRFDVAPDTIQRILGNGRRRLMAQRSGSYATAR